ncbi:MAG: hypothetical protein ACRD2J_06685, partial [Thermoanaerobaculia bacterium]
MPVPVLGFSRAQGARWRPEAAGLAVPPDTVDMLIGEVKEGRVGFNSSATDPDVLAIVLSRFGTTEPDVRKVVAGLRE